MSETTDRTTEDTNVSEKKILSRATISTTETIGAYWKTYDGQENVTYLKTGTNNYCVEGYCAVDYTDYAQLDLVPLNSMTVHAVDAVMAEECLATETSIVNPAGNFVNIAYQIKRTDASPTTLDVFRLMYSTAVTQSSVW